eukprot:877294-Prymnesium_polylepis.1
MACIFDLFCAQRNPGLAVLCVAAQPSAAHRHTHRNARPDTRVARAPRWSLVVACEKKKPTPRGRTQIVANESREQWQINLT